MGWMLDEHSATTDWLNGIQSYFLIFSGQIFAQNIAFL